MNERVHSWSWTWFALGIAALIALGALMPLVGTVFVMASDPCHDQPDLICTASGQQVAFYSPVLGAAGGLLLAIGGTVASPRRWRVWLSVGYLVLLAGWLTGCVIASTGP